MYYFDRPFPSYKSQLLVIERTVSKYTKDIKTKSFLAPQEAEETMYVSESLRERLQTGSADSCSTLRRVDPDTYNTEAEC